MREIPVLLIVSVLLIAGAFAVWYNPPASNFNEKAALSPKVVLSPPAVTGLVSGDAASISGEVARLTSELVSSGGLGRAGVDSGLVAKAKARRQLMLQLADKDPWAFLENVISAGKQAALPAGVKSELEQPIDVTGSLTVMERGHIGLPEGQL